MNIFIAYFVFFTSPIFIHAQTTSAQTANNTSIIHETWFWPMIAIFIALTLLVPITIITIITFCNGDKQLNDTDEISIRSPSLLMQWRRRNLTDPQLPHYAVDHNGSPPPPYTAPNNRSSITSSLPPPYELVPNTMNDTTATVIDVEPTESINYESTDISLSSVSSISSIQTFPV